MASSFREVPFPLKREKNWKFLPDPKDFAKRFLEELANSKKFYRTVLFMSFRVKKKKYI